MKDKDTMDNMELAAMPEGTGEPAVQAPEADQADQADQAGTQPEQDVRPD